MDGPEPLTAAQWNLLRVMVEGTSAVEDEDTALHELSRSAGLGWSVAMVRTVLGQLRDLKLVIDQPGTGSRVWILTHEGSTTFHTRGPWAGKAVRL